jgi:hypothetical protein
LDIKGAIPLSKIPRKGVGKKVSAETLAILPAATALADGEALIIEVDDRRQAIRIYYALARRGFKVQFRGLTLYISKNGTT